MIKTDPNNRRIIMSAWYGAPSHVMLTRAPPPTHQCPACAPYLVSGTRRTWARWPCPHATCSASSTSPTESCPARSASHRHALALLWLAHSSPSKSFSLCPYSSHPVSREPTHWLTHQPMHDTVCDTDVSAVGGHGPGRALQHRLLRTAHPPHRTGTPQVETMPHTV